ncbi:hypothetical protein GGR58DRAFT_493328 [Xylaria digitata]|nr:hypothetical protein GGR58DRAFT_493328 [Xylaria digitata]
MSLPTAAKLLSARPTVNYDDEEKNFTIWDANRKTLKRLFLTENCTLKTVKQRMETEHDFPVFPLINYETTLRDRYHFRKNLKASDWRSIGYRVEKRRLRGKLSHVYLGKILQEPKKVEKEVRRYNKRSILQDQIRRHCVTPPLRQNILIRTPSPEPRRNENAVVRRLSAAEITIRSEWIDTLSLQSPFTQFISILMEQMIPSASVSIAIEIAQRFSVSSMEISPSLREGPDFALLSQACFILSNNLDPDSIFTNALLKWIGISAEFHVLKSFFSIKSHTIRAVWDVLYTASITLRQLRAYNILVELGLSMNKGHWVTGRLSCLIDAINMQATDRVKELSKKPDVGLNLQISDREIPGLVRYMNQSLHRTYVCPLAMAALRCNVDIIQILLKRGTDVDPKPARYRKDQVLSPLFAVLEYLSACREGVSSFASAMSCICALLDAGSTVDVYQSYEPAGRRSRRCGWDGPGAPSWLIDYTWMHFPGKDRLLRMLSEKSSKMKREVTVVGVCLAANRGYEHFQQYLTSRQLPSGEYRIALLQIAISEAAARGLSESVSCLLQLGVDPNVKYIEEEQVSIPRHTRTWHPVVRAARGQHCHVLRILKDSGAYFPPDPIIQKTFNFPIHAASTTTAQSLVEFFRPDIETNGQRLIFLFLKWASRSYFPLCAKVCDIAWSSGVPRVVEHGGRDALHHTIFHGCSLEMVMFLVARGYRVHSKLAHDYNHHSRSSSSTAQTGRPRSSMLGDALASYSFDRLAIVDYLLEQGASTENVREHHHLLESVFITSDNSQNELYNNKIEISARHRDTVELFKKFFYADHSVKKPIRGELPSSVLMGLLHHQVDDSLIFQVIDFTRYIDEEVAGFTPLTKAIMEERLAIAKRLLNRGANVNYPAYERDSTPLVLACGGENIPIQFIEDLINLRADINPPTTDEYRPTALHTAVKYGKLNVTTLLLKHGADINMGCKYRSGKPYITPLDQAAIYGRLDIVHLLRGLGAKSHFQGRTGVDGAISYARSWGYHAIVEFLCSGF